MRKSINQIFKDNKDLLDNEVVQELIEYTQGLEEELIDAEQNQQFSFEVKLTILVNELYADIKSLFKDEEESIRFNEIPPPNFRDALLNLKKYFDKFGRDNNYDFEK